MLRKACIAMGPESTFRGKHSVSYFRQLPFSSLGPISLYKFLIVKEPWWSVYGDLGAFGPTFGHMAQNLWIFGLVIITDKGHI
jgi:hypothetical protein